MRQNGFISLKAIALVLSLIIVVAIGIFYFYNLNSSISPKSLNNQGKTYYDQPLGFYLKDYSKVANISISSIQAKDISQESVPTSSLKEKYNGVLIKWNVVASDKLGKSTYSDVVGTCNIALPVSIKTELPTRIFIRTHSQNACEFWNRIKKNDYLVVIGELNFQDQIVSTQPYKVETFLMVRPMIIKFGNDHYVDNKLPKSVVKQLMNSV